MSKRVTDVIFENCKIYVYYSDCSDPKVYDIANCGDKTPEPEKPGPGPNPHPTPEVRCRVAVHVAAGIVTDRFIDFLNAATPASVASFGVGLAAVVSAKLAAWAWSAALYPSLYVFGFDAVTSGDRDAALTEYNADEQAVIDTVAEALYCVLPDTGEINEQTREVFRAALDGLGGTYTLLAEFMGIYPLERLRDEAFEASITTDEVDCEAFDCEGGGFASACGAADFVWVDIGATPGQWLGINGNVDTTGWTGETLSLDPPGPLFASEAARNPNENWKRTGTPTPSGGPGLRYLAITYTPDAPCVVTSLSFGSLSNSGSGSKMMAIAVQLLDNSWTVLKNGNFSPPPQTDSPGLNWDGDPVTVQQIMWITGHYRGSSTVTVQIRDCKINV